MKKKVNIIKCPKCGAEYLPPEIFIPNAFFGKLDEVERYADYTIKRYYGKPMDTTEHYRCDQCDTPLKITTKLQFNVEEDAKYNFNEDYVSSLRNKSLFLKED